MASLIVLHDRFFWFSARVLAGRETASFVIFVNIYRNPGFRGSMLREPGRTQESTRVGNGADGGGKLGAAAAGVAGEVGSKHLELKA